LECYLFGYEIRVAALLINEGTAWHCTVHIAQKEGVGLYTGICTVQQAQTNEL
jgi:hypothetical protein